jgi:fatty-acyl-CoA synthase
MSDRHLKFWPANSAWHLSTPQTNLFYNAEVSAKRYPDKPFLIFYDTVITFTQFATAACQLAGFLEHQWHVRRGDRVLLMMQNSPQFIISYYGILRANAVVVPINPMSVTRELSRYAQDCAATGIIVAQDLYARVEPLLGHERELTHALVATYSDYLNQPGTPHVPEFIRAPRRPLTHPASTHWIDMQGLDAQPGALSAGPDDLCVMPYTSGTTGVPKACMHTHRSTMHTAVGSMRWHGLQPETTVMAVAPLFHVTGMQGSMNGPLYLGSTVVLLPRWDRDAAAELVQRYRVATFTSNPTMLQDFFANPKLSHYDLSCLRRLSGGGAAMPAALAQRLESLGVAFLEGYGLSETIAPSHLNPPAHHKAQCLGIPIYDTDSRIIDPTTLEQLPDGEIGEIVTHGPQVMLGYWNKPQETADAFIELDGKRFLRTGDLARIDEEGYFFMVDRLKRMINASGFKVWPAEVEALMYAHPAVLEACVISATDSYRGETVKVIIVLRPEWYGKISESQIIAWGHEQMAAYKAPRRVQFVDTLPKSASGKILWSELQEREIRAHEHQAITATSS